MNENFEKTLEKIKSRGYWRINVFPNNKKQSLPIPECKELVRTSSVSLRGWDYPHIPTHNDAEQEFYVIDKRIESWIDWHLFKEVWRFYCNGQFVHFFGMLDDWYEDDPMLVNTRYQTVKPGEAMDVLGLLFRLTEIYSFIKNLSANPIYDDGINIEISLCNTKNRKLVLLDTSRVPLSCEYKNFNDNIILQKKLVSPKESEDNFKKFALEDAKHIYQQFQWENPPISNFEEDQNKLIERRI